MSKLDLVGTQSYQNYFLKSYAQFLLLKYLDKKVMGYKL